jgi:hypothetical protein
MIVEAQLAKIHQCKSTLEVEQAMVTNHEGDGAAPYLCAG